MRILVARNVIYSYLLGDRSPRGALSAYLLNRIQRDQHLQGFLTEAAYQDALSKVKCLKQSSLEQARFISVIRQTLQLLPKGKTEGLLLNSSENEEIACALRHNLDALVTHDLSYHQLTTSLLIWTVGEFLNQNRRSKLNRTYLTPSQEATVRSLINHVIPVTDGPESRSVAELTEHLFQQLGSLAYSSSDATDLTTTQRTTFGNELRPEAALHLSADDLLHRVAPLDRSEPELAHAVHSNQTAQTAPVNRQILELELWNAEATKANLAFHKSLIPALALMLLLFKLEINQPQVTIALEQRSLFAGIGLPELAISAGLGSNLSSLLSHFLTDMQKTFVEAFLSVITLPEVEFDTRQFALINGQSGLIDRLVDGVMAAIGGFGGAAYAAEIEDSGSSGSSLLQAVGGSLMDAASQALESIQNSQAAGNKASSIPGANRGPLATKEALINQIIDAVSIADSARSPASVGEPASSASSRVGNASQGYDEQSSNPEVKESAGDDGSLGPNQPSSSFRVGANGTSGDDWLYIGRGESNNIYINSGRGDDTIVASDGDDFLNGDRGNDTLTGGLGSDTFITGYGTATITDFNAAEGDRIDIVGTVSDYKLTTVGSSTEIRVESATVARLLDVPVGQLVAVVQNTPGQRLNFVTKPINRPLTGSDTNDVLTGNSGSNLLAGGAGNDTLIGGRGQTAAEFNLLEGGAGADKFVLGNETGRFHSTGGFSTIADFNASQGDRLQLAGSADAYIFEVVGADTEIRTNKFQISGGQLIGVVKNTTSLNASTDVEFVDNWTGLSKLGATTFRELSQQGIL